MSAANCRLSSLPAPVLQHLALFLDPDSLAAVFAALPGVKAEFHLGKEFFWRRYGPATGVTIAVLSEGCPLRSGKGAAARCLGQTVEEEEEAGSAFEEDGDEARAAARRRSAKAVYERMLQVLPVGELW